MMQRPGYDQGIEDARSGRLARQDGDEEYYISYQREAGYWDAPQYEPEPPEPEPEDLCAALGHPYYGDDEHGGRCYCGSKVYPFGGETDGDGSE